MERTVWIVALALAAMVSVSCKDSTPNYISFDAQAPGQAVDAKADVPPKADAGSVSDTGSAVDAVDAAASVDAVADTASDDGGTGQ